MKSGTKLDFETRTSYMVTLTATDSFSDSASIDVTIKVTDVDEAPKISEGGLAISGPASVSYAEDRRDAVATYSGHRAGVGQRLVDAGRRRCWGLRASAVAECSPSCSGPDFENPADDGTGTTCT